MSKTKIVVIQLKEIIYTAIFVGLGILLILLLVFMFLPKDKKPDLSQGNSKYNAGVYSTQLMLGDTALNVEVIVDSDHVNSVKIANLNETITTMYPLIEPALKEIETQLSNNIPIGDVKISEDSKYTQTLLLEAVETTLKKAEN